MAAAGAGAGAAGQPNKPSVPAWRANRNRAFDFTVIHKHSNLPNKIRKKIPRFQ